MPNLAVCPAGCGGRNSNHQPDYEPACSRRNLPRLRAVKTLQRSAVSQTLVTWGPFLQVVPRETSTVGSGARKGAGVQIRSRNHSFRVRLLSLDIRRAPASLRIGCAQRSGVPERPDRAPWSGSGAFALPSASSTSNSLPQVVQASVTLAIARDDLPWSGCSRLRR
jgi:hypothetical protein